MDIRRKALTKEVEYRRFTLALIRTSRICIMNFEWERAYSPGRVRRVDIHHRLSAYRACVTAGDGARELWVNISI